MEDEIERQLRAMFFNFMIFVLSVTAIVALIIKGCFT